MKLTTALLCSILGMTASSVSVWALVPEATQPGPANKPTIAAPEAGPATLAKLVGLGVGATAEFRAGTTVTMAGRLGHPVLAAGRESETYLFLDVQAAEGTATAQAPVDLAIVLDRSGSMQGERMANALAAAQGMIRRLRDGDTVSVVGYNTQTQVLLSPTRIDERSRELAVAALGSVEAVGNTCVSCGVEAAMDLLAAGRRSGVQRILLLSDGEANTGIRDVDGFRRLGERARGMETAVSSIGVDVDYNERVLFALSQSSNGRHYFVDDARGLPRIFDDELRSLVSTVASNAEAEITLAPGVTVAEVFDRAFEQRGDRVTVPFGTFSAADEKTVLLRLRVPAGDAGARPIASVRMRYEDLLTGEPGDCQGQLVAMVSRDAGAISSLDGIVEARLARSETTAALSLANEQFARGDVGGARSTLSASRGRIHTRRKEASSATPAPLRNKIEADFDRQIGALNGADEAFGRAQNEAPAPTAAPQTRTGKAAVRGNADLFDDFSQ